MPSSSSSRKSNVTHLTRRVRVKAEPIEPAEISVQPGGDSYKGTERASPQETILHRPVRRRFKKSPAA